MNFTNNTMTLNSTSNGSVRRIRTPHPHDVLSGRGGGINGHVSLKCASRDTRHVKVFGLSSLSLSVNFLRQETFNFASGCKYAKQITTWHLPKSKRLV